MPSNLKTIGSIFFKFNQKNTIATGKTVFFHDQNKISSRFSSGLTYKEEIFLTWQAPQNLLDDNESSVLGLSSEYFKAFTNSEVKTLTSIPLSSFSKSDMWDNGKTPLELDKGNLLQKFTIQNKEIIKKFNFLLPSICKDITRRFMCGIYFDKNTTISTNGQTLQKIDLDTKEEIDISFFLQNKAVETLLSICKKHKNNNSTFYIYENAIEIKSENYTILQLEKEDKFPPYKQVLPNATQDLLKIRVEDLKKALNFAIKNNKDRSHKRINIKNDQIRFKSLEQTQIIPLNADIFREIDIDLNAKYLLASLKLDCENVSLSSSGIKNGPIVISYENEKGNALSLVMPLRKEPL